MQSRLACLSEQLSTDGIDFREKTPKRFLIDLRIGPERAEQLFLALELLQHVSLQIGARRDVGNIEQRQQCSVMIRGGVLRREEARTGKQILEPHQRAYALVQRMLVANHDGSR